MASASVLHALRPHEVRSQVPAGSIGAYRLYYNSPTGYRLFYTGRSDTNLQRRLLQHANRYHNVYFDFTLLDSAVKAYQAECGAFHANQPRLLNLIHPAHPAGKSSVCPFCVATIQRIRQPSESLVI